MSIRAPCHSASRAMASFARSSALATPGVGAEGGSLASNVAGGAAPFEESPRLSGEGAIHGWDAVREASNTTAPASFAIGSVFHRLQFAQTTRVHSYQSPPVSCRLEGIIKLLGASAGKEAPVPLSDVPRPRTVVGSSQVTPRPTRLSPPPRRSWRETSVRQVPTLGAATPEYLPALSPRGWTAVTL